MFQPTPPRGRRPPCGETWQGRQKPFQPTPPRGRRQIGSVSIGKDEVFQPTPPRGRRRGRESRRQRADRVSTHASAREATTHRGAARPAPCGFNPRLRAGGDGWKLSSSSTSKLFQPTPPRGRRHRLRPTFAGLGDVSTHASAREATRQVVLAEQALEVSTHASAREATRGFAQAQTRAEVSTHASAREATALHSTTTVRAGFQPTPPRGRRPHAIRSGPPA